MKKLFVDLDGWRLLVAHTDILAILGDASIADYARRAEAAAAELAAESAHK